MGNVIDIVKRCLSFEDEQEWFDFKDSWYELDEIGQYISVLSNAAAMHGEHYRLIKQRKAFMQVFQFRLMLNLLRFLYRFISVKNQVAAFRGLLASMAKTHLHFLTTRLR